MPGHPFRPLSVSSKRRKGSKEQPPVPKSVHLIDCIEEESDEEDAGEKRDSFAFNERHVVIKGEFDLTPGHSEDEIRSELVEVFKTKIPNIRTTDFDFVKREKNVISLPVIKTGFKWDFAHVKNLCGQGRLYVRLNVPKDELLERGNSDDELSKTVFSFAESAPAFEENTSCIEIDPNCVPRQSSQYGYEGLEICTPGSSSLTNRPGISRTEPSGVSGFGNVSSFPGYTMPDAGHSTVNVEDDKDELRPPGATNSPLDQQKVDNLAVIFPRIPRGVIQNAVMTCGSVNSAVNVLLQYNSVGNNTGSDDDSADYTPEISSGPETLPHMLKRLRSKMQPRGTREKIKVDQDDLVMDVYGFYKSADFDPTIPIFVSLKGQPAIDTGGVLRQVFSDVFYSMANNEGVKNVFNGDKYNKVPAFSNELVVNGLFEVLGKMIAHSLIQSGPGFPYLSPTIYWYLATGDLQIAIQKASCLDVDDIELAEYVTRVSLLFGLCFISCGSVLFLV